MVKQGGVTVQQAPLPALLLVALSSPEGRYDSRYLSNYAIINLRDELARVPGVGDVAFLGEWAYTLRIQLSPEKLEARNLTTRWWRSPPTSPPG